MFTYSQPSLFDGVGPADGPALADPKHEVVRGKGGVELRSRESEQILTPGRGRLEAYDYSLNPYRGCGFGCTYCYAANFVVDEAQRARWGSWVEVKTHAVAALRRRDIRGKRIYMSSATDPYQPIEVETELTRGLLEEMVLQQPRLVIQTRGPLVIRDIDLLRRIRHLRVNLSITTDDDLIRREFEPRCASIERRLEAVLMLKEAGITVGVCVSPMLPMRDPASFGKLLTQLKVDIAGASWFHRSDRQFAASTRPDGEALLAAHGWTYGNYLTARDAMERTCLAFETAGAVFAPV